MHPLFNGDEMKFIGTGIVWDKDANKPLCEFENGFYETEDKDEIEKLLAAGFKQEEIPTIQEVKLPEIIQEPKGKKKK
jgi:hypothetical protein